jgi:copper chaperone
MQTITLQVQGMTCGHCVKSVEGALKEIGAEGKVDLAAGKVEIQFDEAKLQVETIKEAIEDQGYDIV